MPKKSNKPAHASDKSPTSRSAEIVLALKRSIMAQQLRPGDALPKEEDLARQFNVGRPLIREALGVLKSQGYLEARRGNLGGTFVKDLLQFDEMGHLLSDWVMMGHMSVRDLLFVRLLIEPEAARMTALNASAVDIQRLKDLIECAKNAPTVSESVSYHVDFHNQIGTLSANPFFALLIRSCMNFTRMFVEMFVEKGKDIHDAAFHDAILQAIAGRDPQLAYERMYLHVANLKEEMVPLEQAFLALSHAKE